MLQPVARRAAADELVADLLAEDGQWAGPESASDVEQLELLVSVQQAQPALARKVLRRAQAQPVSAALVQLVRRALPPEPQARLPEVLVRRAPSALQQQVRFPREVAQPEHVERPGGQQADAWQLDVQEQPADEQPAHAEREPERASARRVLPARASAPLLQVRVRTCPAIDGGPFRQPRAEWNWNGSSFQLHQAPAKDR